MLNNIMIWFTHMWSSIVVSMGGNPIVDLASIWLSIGGCIVFVGIQIANIDRKGK